MRREGKIRAVLAGIFILGHGGVLSSFAFMGPAVPAVPTGPFPQTNVATAIRRQYSSNPFEEETSDQRKERMKLVRGVQKTFYSDEVGVYPAQFGVYSNLLIYRADWTELPGFQHVMNVTDPDYTNMLMRCVSSSRPWYFGHVYLPEGADGDEYNYRLEKWSDAPLIGTLMQVSDYKVLDDGNLYVVVQALGRFMVIDSIQSSPYGIANVEMLPDQEMVEHFYEEAEDTAATFDFALNDNARGAACAGAVADAGVWRDYEFQDATLDDNDGNFPPVANFDVNAASSVATNAGDIVHAAIEEYLSQSPSNMFHGECSIDLDGPDVATEEDSIDAEFQLWCELDNLAKILTRLNPKANTEMPIPTQILGLLPADKDGRSWPKGFKLSRYTKKMSNVYSILEKNSNLQLNKDEPDQLKAVEGYPRLRRARRLSYIVWALLDTILGDDYIKEEGRVTKQQILEMSSTTARLKAALLRIREINETLKQVLEKN
uniref:Lon N-terminal domain-containing protein n=1 Tax=Minutocellus polymorphus TaxID=265543 RepID=A0A7S0AHP3_9STRA